MPETRTHYMIDHKDGQPGLLSYEEVIELQKVIIKDQDKLLVLWKTYYDQQRSISYNLLAIVFVMAIICLALTIRIYLHH